MYSLENLCRDICLPEEVIQTVLTLSETVTCPTDKLCRKEDWDAGLEEVRAALGEDPDGFGILTCMLKCAVARRENFLELGCSHQVYVDTMKCFSRFVGEHMASFGRYGFDRGFWTVRQLSCLIFRFGQLEYELAVEQGLKVVKLHIPSDARLEKDLLRQSYEQARDFLIPRFPDHANGLWICGSWLLSPILTEILPDTSRIRLFQSGFQILKAYPDPQFRQWAYKRMDIADEDLPENTSLQRKLKAYLLAGNTFQSGLGVLKREPFLY